MKISFSNALTITEAPERLVREIENRLTIPNPAYEEAVRMGRWTGNTPEFLALYSYTRGGIVIPRGFIRQLIAMVRRQGVAYKIFDRRRTLPEVDLGFTGTLKPYQEAALADILKRDSGTLSSPPGSGKTVMAMASIARRKQPTLVIVHTRELQNQWLDRIETFLGIPKNEIGRIGGGKFTIGDRITVGIVNSVYGRAEEIREHIGHLILDECHRTPSRTFTEAVSAFDCQYILGLSATPWRRDKLSKLIYWFVGDVVHKIERGALVEEGHILPFDVIRRETDFTSYFDPVTEYSQVLSELTRDRDRNIMIAADVALEASNGTGVCLVLSDRKEHCLELQRVLADIFKISADELTGDLSKADREAIVARLEAGQVKVLIATGQLIGEGFDCKGLTTLFLATPIKFDGRLIQYVGRVMRPAPGKERALVYDYVDGNVGVLAASARTRQRVYEQAQVGG